jgi:plastocyanin
MPPAEMFQPGTSAPAKRLVVHPMTHTTKRRRLVATAALVSVLAFGACSDDDDGGGSATASAENDGNAVAIADFTFKPGDLQVAAGTTVTFTNEDGFAHTATAKDKSFDSGNLEQDAAFEHTFEDAGTFEYLCAIHNSMTGTITVS